MAWFSRDRRRQTSGPLLQIENLDVYYGRAHALQGVSLTDEQFREEVKARREHLKLKPGEDAPGCPLCAFETIPGAPPARTGQQ